MTVGQTIRQLRQARGQTQAELAGMLGISASYLSLIETDKREPSIPLLREAASKLGAPASLLFAQALAGTQQDPFMLRAQSVLAELTSIVAAKNLPLDLDA